MHKHLITFTSLLIVKILLISKWFSDEKNVMEVNCQLHFALTVDSYNCHFEPLNNSDIKTVQSGEECYGI